MDLYQSTLKSEIGSLYGIALNLNTPFFSFPSAAEINVVQMGVTREQDLPLGSD